MKLFSKLISLSLFSVLVFSSCNDGVTYAQQLKDEKELIADYIKRENIKVVKEFPKEFPWGDKVYVLTKSGMYFRLESQGDTTLKVAANDKVISRFYQHTLNAISPDTLFNWNTLTYPFPTTFNYADATQVCEGWHEAVSYMKYNNSRAHFILHSKIGFETTGNDVVPYGFEMKIKIQK